MGNVWEMFGKCLGNVWEMFGKCLELSSPDYQEVNMLFWEMFGKCLGNVWEMFGKCLGNVWEMFGKFKEWIWCREFEECLISLRSGFGVGKFEECLGI